MITFLDERDVEHGALATIKVTNAVNGERSLTGEIESGDYVLTNIERGWRLRFNDEFYVVTYAKPIDDGKATHVTFDAVHQFFWDFDKSSVHEQLNDGSHTVLNYLDFIFADSGYTYTIDPLLKVYAFEKQSFGYKSRLNLFNDIITASGVEFQVNGKVVRILEKTGTDLSTVVRKNFNMNELGIEKHIGDFVTYQKGFGAWVDENDHTKGRLVTEYTSPLASVYGKLEAEPLVDERYTQADNMIAALKANVDNSYSLSIRLDMEDLTRAGYEYTQPRAGDYIMAINETLDFQEKIRIVSFTSEYDVSGQLVKHEVTCNDIGVVKKLSASYNLTKEQAKNASDSVGKAVEMANKALVSADGKSTVYFGNEFPKDEPKGTLHKGDSLYLTVGDTTKMYYWTGADWEELPIVNDVEAFKEQIADELKDVPNREEFEATITEKLATSKAEIKTQIDTAKTQAESNAKAYADEINQATAEVAEQANTAANSLKSDLAKVKTDLTTTTSTANAAKTSASEAKQQLTTVANDLSKAKTDLKNAVSEVDTKATNLQSDLTKAKQDLTSQASQLTAQANAQSELTKRVSTVEETAIGTKSTVGELSKTVDSNTKNITSVTARTKTVEDDLTSTKTTLSQVKTTADGASQKTATLETGLNGLSARFSSLKIGGRNLLTKTNQGKTNWGWTISSGGTTAEDYDVDGINAVKLTRTIDSSASWSYIQYQGLLRNLIEPNTQYTLSFDVKPNINANFTATLMQGDAQNRLTNSVNMGTALADVWTRISCVLTSVATLPNSVVSQVVYLQGMPTANGNTVIFKNIKLEKGNIATDYSPNEADLEQKVAEYKQTADQNYASLQTTVKALDGTVTANKATADQTAAGFKTRIESLETYKDGETTRANQYFESAKTETARQLTAERTAIAKDYVAKSTYTSDVTGIRNDLTATTMTANTTKTNLANYQASNDKAVANLQSNLQTANGNISSLQTKVEAVPGQITSAVSSVEGKIPTSASQRNLVEGTSVAWSPFVNITTNNNWRYELATVKYGDKTGIYAGTTINIFVYLSADEIVLDSSINPSFFMQGPIIDKNGAETWTNWDKYHPFCNKWSTNLVSGNNYRIVKLSTKVTSESYLNINGFKIEVRIDGVKSGKFHHRALMVTTGDVFPDSWSPAPEDYDSKLASAQSEIKQTTDAISASVSSVQTAASNAQSTANTAVSKADAAQAGVNTLDSTTVKSASLTINTDGIVMKAGKSTTDVANAIGSYFSVNQNAINLFSDKINVKGSMIVDGAITSDKIASKQINTAHFNGKIITADVISSNAVTADAIKAGAVTTDKMSANSINGDRITAGTLDAAKIKAGSISASQIASGTLTSEQIKAGAIKSINIEASAITSDKIASNSIDASKIVTNGLTANIIKGGKLQSLSNATNFELDTGKLFYNNNNTGVFRVEDGASTMGLKFTNTAITVNGSSKVLSRVILGGDRRESTLDDGKWDQGGFTGIVAETINGVASNTHDKADTLRAIADNIYFTHSYKTDALTGVSAAGWKMETYAPNTSYKGNVVLKPYGVSYRQSNIVVGDLRLDNGDGSGYWMRATINVLKACFGHIVNGGVSGDALSAIRSELNKISGT